MSRKSVIIASFLAICVVCVVSGIVCGAFALRAHSEVVIDPNTYYPVTYVVDGDTFKALVNQKEITVRVLGINTPETVDPRKPVECYGPEASKQAKALLDGHKVRLVFNPNRETMDKYGRYLMYAYRDDGLFYNEAMIKDGYAMEYTVGTPYSFQSEFRVDQKIAQKAALGLWGACK